MKRFRALLIGILATCALACSGDGSPSEVRTDDRSPPVRPPNVPTEYYGVRLKVVTTGTNVDPDGYVVGIQLGYSGRMEEVSIGVTDSVLFKINQRPAPEGWFVRLVGLAANCWVAPPNLRHVRPQPDGFLLLEYQVECVPPSTVYTYDRVTPHWPNSVSFHGSLSERYVLRADGMFRLQYTSGRFGFFEYFGSFRQTPGDALRLHFEWDGDGRWSGTAILRNDTLSVDYNEIMVHSDFEPGVYVKANIGPS